MRRTAACLLSVLLSLAAVSAAAATTAAALTAFEDDFISSLRSSTPGASTMVFAVVPLRVTDEAERLLGNLVLDHLRARTASRLRAPLPARQEFLYREVQFQLTEEERARALELGAVLKVEAMIFVSVVDFGEDVILDVQAVDVAGGGTLRSDSFAMGPRAELDRIVRLFYPRLLPPRTAVTLSAHLGSSILLPFMTGPGGDAIGAGLGVTSRSSFGLLAYTIVNYGNAAGWQAPYYSGYVTVDAGLGYQIAIDPTLSMTLKAGVPLSFVEVAQYCTAIATSTVWGVEVFAGIEIAFSSTFSTCVELGVHQRLLGYPWEGSGAITPGPFYPLAKIEVGFSL